MILQESTRNEVGRIWEQVYNSDGQTLTTHFPVFKFLSGRNTASVSTNEVGRGANAAGLVGNAMGSLLGLADENIANGAVGLVQIYGYHESALVMRIASSVTVVPGHAMGPGDLSAANSVGVSSTGLIIAHYGPIVALDTVTATLHSLGTVGENFVNHVFIRCM